CGRRTWWAPSLSRYEFQRHTVIAITQSRGSRTVVEHMALMSAATGAVVFGAGHDHLVVDFRFQMAVDVGEKTRPAGTAVEFHIRCEQCEIACRANKRAFAMLMVQRARSRALGAFLA